jgi:hypothetical protein
MNYPVTTKSGRSFHLAPDNGKKTLCNANVHMFVTGYAPGVAFNLCDHCDKKNRHV